MKALGASAFAYVATLLLTSAAMAVAVLVLAGPHSDVLPAALAPLVMLLAACVILVLPAWVAHRVWRRLA